MPGFWDDGLRGYTIDNKVLDKLIAEEMPDVANALEDLGGTIQILSSKCMS